MTMIDTCYSFIDPLQLGEKSGGKEIIWGYLAHNLSRVFFGGGLSAMPCHPTQVP